MNYFTNSDRKRNEVLITAAVTVAQSEVKWR